MSFKSTTNQGGGHVRIPTRVPHRSARNERDLGLALRARDITRGRAQARRIAGAVDEHYTHSLLKSFVAALSADQHLGLSAKQLAIVCRVLEIHAPPPLPAPPAQVLPLKPPRPQSFE